MVKFSISGFTNENVLLFTIVTTLLLILINTYRSWKTKENWSVSFCLFPYILVYTACNVYFDILSQNLIGGNEEKTMEILNKESQSPRFYSKTLSIIEIQLMIYLFIA
jgi:hypothetical protein